MVSSADSNLDHNQGGHGLTPDLNPECLCANATNLDPVPDQNASV